MKREVYTFSPGPCIFPLDVLQETQSQIRSETESVLEYSNGSPKAKQLVQEVTALFKETLQIPDNFTFLISCGGATNQFATIPYNLLDSAESTGSYIVNGTWSELAFKECKSIGKAHLCNPEQPRKQWTYAPTLKESSVPKDSKYLYYCDNETVHGIEFPQPPDSFGLPLATDMTSNFLTRPVDFSKFGVVYSGAQKNWGPAGLVIAIVRNDLLERKGLADKPFVMDYKAELKTNAEGKNIPIFALALARNTLKWIQRNGGLQSMDRLAKAKAKLIYDVIDASNGFYVNKVRREHRSRVNIVCQLCGNDETLTKLFIKEAAKSGLVQLGGHKSVGGLRFSIYNGMPVDGVERLRAFMIDFQKSHENRPKL